MVAAASTVVTTIAAVSGIAGPISLCQVLSIVSLSQFFAVSSHISVLPDYADVMETIAWVNLRALRLSNGLDSSDHRRLEGMSFATNDLVDLDDDTWDHFLGTMLLIGVIFLGVGLLHLLLLWYLKCAHRPARGLAHWPRLETELVFLSLIGVVEACATVLSDPLQYEKGFHVLIVVVVLGLLLLSGLGLYVYLARTVLAARAVVFVTHPCLPRFTKAAHLIGSQEVGLKCPYLHLVQ